MYPSLSVCLSPLLPACSVRTGTLASWYGLRAGSQKTHPGEERRREGWEEGAGKGNMPASRLSRMQLRENLVPSHRLLLILRPQPATAPPPQHPYGPSRPFGKSAEQVVCSPPTPQCFCSIQLSGSCGTLYDTGVSWGIESPSNWDGTDRWKREKDWAGWEQLKQEGKFAPGRVGSGHPEEGGPR